VRKSYLDTNIVLYVVRGEFKRLTKRAIQALERSELWISPMVVLELNYLYECGRIVVRADVIMAELNRALDARICNFPFDKIVAVAAKESWTRDAFDRLIVSHAKANDESPLITSDSVMSLHYPHVIW
jgi:PIN domain nuclease of toxin-antitoxin system